MLARRFDSAALTCERPWASRDFGLGNVGAGHLADVEAVARLPQLLLEDLDVVALEVEVRRVPQHVHIGGRAIEQDVLLDAAQGLARAEHERFGLLHRVIGREVPQHGRRWTEIAKYLSAQVF